VFTICPFGFVKPGCVEYPVYESPVSPGSGRVAVPLRIAPEKVLLPRTGNRSPQPVTGLGTLPELYEALTFGCV
jgi:hypothetical protein